MGAAADFSLCALARMLHVCGRKGGAATQMLFEIFRPVVFSWVKE